MLAFFRLNRHGFTHDLTATLNSCEIIYVQNIESGLKGNAALQLWQHWRDHEWVKYEQYKPIADGSS